MAATTLLPLQFRRQDAVAIDEDLVFATTAARLAYLTSPRRYAGMIVGDAEEEKAYILNAARDTWIAIGTTDTVFMFQVGVPPPLGTHVHYALLTVDVASSIIHNTNPSLPVGDPGQPSATIVTESAGAPAHTHSLTVVFDYDNHTFIVTAISNNTLDNHEANIVGGRNVHVQDEGSSLGVKPLATLNFVGTGVVASSSDGGATVTVNITGGGGASVPTVLSFNQANTNMDPGHFGNIIRLNYATNQTYTVTETVGSECPPGTSVVLTWSGIGLVTIVQGANAVVFSPETLNIRKRYGQVTLTKMVAPNVWQVEGNLQTS